MAGSISHREPESLAGRLSYPQKSIFGRFGWTMAQPLYRELNTDFYQPELSDLEPYFAVTESNHTGDLPADNL